MARVAVTSRRPRSRHQTGSVTAEAAVVLPIVAAFALTLIWMISVVVAEVRAVDAARDAARAVARGDGVAAAVAQARNTSPDGSHVTISRHGDLVTARVSFAARPPGWLLVPLPSVEVGSTSTVEVEGDAASAF
jgi:hypothetical protein